MLLFFYNIVVVVAFALLRMAKPFMRHDSKIRRFIYGQQRVMHRLEAIRSDLANERIIWVHASSYGEYNIIRPVLQQIREKTPYKILFTFFSVTGIDTLAGWTINQSQADHILYLPLDSRSRVRQFLDAVKPEKAVFVKSEFWPNYLHALRQRRIPTYLVSAVVSDRSALLRCYGHLLFGEAVKTFTHATTLSEVSLRNMQKAGIENAELSGDPLFDYVATMAQRDYSNPIVERFLQSAGGRLFICGSINDANDLELVSHLAKKHPDTKFLFVPHEVSSRRLWTIESHTQGRSKRYSLCTDQEDFSATQILIIDFVGALSRLYRYGTWAYVGGGFTPLIHSIIEPVAYGLPVAFGPRIEKHITPRQVAAIGVGTIVQSADDIDQWFTALKHADDKLADIREKAMRYTRQNQGATQHIVQLICQ